MASAGNREVSSVLALAEDDVPGPVASTGTREFSALALAEADVPGPVAAAADREGSSALALEEEALASKPSGTEGATDEGETFARPLPR